MKNNLKIQIDLVSVEMFEKILDLHRDVHRRGGLEGADIDIPFGNKSEETTK